MFSVTRSHREQHRDRRRKLPRRNPGELGGGARLARDLGRDAGPSGCAPQGVHGQLRDPVTPPWSPFELSGAMSEAGGQLLGAQQARTRSHRPGPVPCSSAGFS